MFFIFLFFYGCIFFSLLFFFLGFVEWDPLKSCLMLCLGVLFMSCHISFGLHVWYSYFVVLIFLSGILSLMIYFCSISSYKVCYNYRYFYFFCIFLCVSLFFFDFDCFSFDNNFNFLIVYYDVNYPYIFWIIFVLMLLLVSISFSLDGDMCVRCL